MHHSFNRHPQHGTTLAGLAALLLLTFPPAQAVAMESEATATAFSLEKVEGTVETIMITSIVEFFEIVWNSSTENRLALAEDCDQLVYDLSQLSREPEEIVLHLAAALDAEPDAWIRFTCLLSLSDDGPDPHLAPLFLHFLDEGRPADLWPALVWLAENKNPDALPHLQALWPARNRPWLRPLLIQAVANRGSNEHLEVFMHLAQTDLPGEDDLSGVAVHALARPGDEDRFRPMLRVTPDSGRSLRCWAGPGQIQSWEDGPALRIPSGAAAGESAVFDGPDGVLVKQFFPECWLPQEQLAWRRLEPEESDLSYFWGLSSAESDFDIPLKESSSETAQALEEAGLVEFFDPGPGTIGAALVIDENRPELRDLLLLFSKAGDAPLLQEALSVIWRELVKKAEENP